MTLFKAALALSILVSSTAFAVPSVVCTAKLLDQKNSEYREEQLKIGNDSNGLYTARLVLGDCSFSAQSMDPAIFRLDVRQMTDDSGLSNYGGFDTKGHIIATFSKDHAKFICMLVCSKAQP